MLTQRRRRRTVQRGALSAPSANRLRHVSSEGAFAMPRKPGTYQRLCVAGSRRCRTIQITPPRLEKSPQFPGKAMTKPNRYVTVGNVRFANDAPLALIAGPCQFESRQHAFDIAGALQELAARLGIGLVYKTSYDKANRTSLSSTRGAGLAAAMPVFDELREKLGVPVLTDVHTEEQVALVAPHVDVLQIPAFLSRQTDLLVAAARTGKVVNVKKGQFLAPWDMKNVVAKVTGSGNANVLVTERGASFGYNTLVSDMRASADHGRDRARP